MAKKAAEKMAGENESADMHPGSGGRLRYPPAGTVFRVVAAVLCRPHLWVTAVAQCFRLARRRWWSRPPFLPVPTREYLAFRAVTQYGGNPDQAVASISAGDVVNYLRWCRQWNRSGL